MLYSISDMGLCFIPFERIIAAKEAYLLFSEEMHYVH